MSRTSYDSDHHTRVTMVYYRVFLGARSTSDPIKDTGFSVLKMTENEDGEWIDGADGEAQDDNGMVTCLLWPDATPMFRTSYNVPYVTPQEKRKHNRSSLLYPHVAVSTTNYVQNPVPNFQFSLHGAVVIRLFAIPSVGKMKCDKRTRIRPASLSPSS
ncbi:hypothetical protein EDD16DRAFT_1521300 [Pisolithus croceorrhizus]|nr:hypothetical protein EDD16DRAFT_1521300 [Pisolithus croceorrhizus]